MGIRIPPPTEYDNISPEAKAVIDDAGDQLKAWIEKSVDDIHVKTQQEINQVVETAKADIQNLESEVLNNLKSMTEDVESMVSEIQALSDAVMQGQISSTEFANKLREQLAEREQKYTNLGKDLVTIASSALSKVSGITL